MMESLTQSDRHAIEACRVQVNGWQELAAGLFDPGWSWQDAGTELQHRCSLIMADLDANRKNMTVAEEVEGLVQLLFETGERLKSFDDVVSKEFGAEPEAIEAVWRDLLAWVGSIMREVNSLSADMPLASNTKSVRTYKQHERARKILEEAGGTVTVEDVWKDLRVKDEEIKEMTLAAYKKNVERGEKKVEGERPTRADKLRNARSINKQRVRWLREYDDDGDEFHEHD